MEISFISEVGKKNVPETSSITNSEGENVPWESSTQRGPRTSRTKRLYRLVGENKLLELV